MSEKFDSSGEPITDTTMDITQQAVLDALRQEGPLPEKTTGPPDWTPSLVSRVIQIYGLGPPAVVQAALDSLLASGRVILREQECEACGGHGEKAPRRQRATGPSRRVGQEVPVPRRPCHHCTNGKRTCYALEEPVSS